jgi:hypothetical protein
VYKYLPHTELRHLHQSLLVYIVQQKHNHALGMSAWSRLDLKRLVKNTTEMAFMSCFLPKPRLQVSMCVSLEAVDDLSMSLRSSRSV